MEKSRRELESLVNAQKEQLIRYEARLKDVVTAYKGLLKEKDALESSLSTFTNASNKTDDSKNNSTEKIPDTSTNLPQNQISEIPNTSRRISQNSDLQLQITTLMNSLATLSAEKSRMEQSFQADKKKLRNDLIKKDEIIDKLEEKVKQCDKKNSVDVENMKSKVIIERHEREKETNNQMVMIRELQKLLADERHLKENFEMQLNDLKNQITSTSSTGNKVKDLAAELKETKTKLKQFENSCKDIATSASIATFQDNQLILQQLQNETKHLKQQHAVAIRAEQNRVQLAEERSKKLAALHEDRVANLEARLAELSSTVGNYDRLRQQDQENIQKLKEKIAKLACNAEETEINQRRNSITPAKRDLQSLCDEIIHLKKVLLIENARSQAPIDLNKLFNTGGFGNNDHSQCQDDNAKLQEELDKIQHEDETNCATIAEQKHNIKTLQEKIKVLNRNIDEQENELKFQNDRFVKTLKDEKFKFKSSLTSFENEYRSKINDMEQQLQKQRIRSLQLLDEKEDEIKALKTSFEIFIPHQIHPEKTQQLTNFSDDGTIEGDIDNYVNLRKSSAVHIQAVLNSNSVNGINSTNHTGENCHMIHYANEIARKDVEISALRKSKHSAESSLRQALQDKVTTQEELHNKIENLEEDVDRLERCKTREGANLEYLKNVFISFLSTSNTEGKKHMINAIAAVLQFTPAEMKAINIIMFSK